MPKVDDAYKVIISGTDYTKYVQSINNTFTLDEVDSTASSINLKADSAQENVELLRKIIQHVNNQEPIKVYMRGYYSTTAKLRMSGYVLSMSGQSPFGGLSIMCRNIQPTQNVASTLGTNQTTPYIGKTVDEIVLDVIKKWGFIPGKIDKFPIQFESWYLGGRTFTEAMTVLADFSNAIVSYDLEPVKITGTGALKINGIFDPTADDNQKNEQSGKDSDKATGKDSPVYVHFRNPNISDDEYSDNRYGQDYDYIMTDGSGETTNDFANMSLVNTPNDMPLKFGKGQWVNGHAPVAGRQGNSTDGFTYSEDDQFKSKEQLAFESNMKKKFDPYVMELFKGAKIYAYQDNDDPSKITQYVKMADNNGKEVVVPVDVAAATLRGRRVVNFIHNDESKGMLGDSGLILTLTPGELEYPNIRVKEIIGYEYLPPVSADEQAIVAPGLDGSRGATKKNFKSQELRISAANDMSFEEMLKAYPQMATAFRRISYMGKSYYIAYDPGNISVDDVTGTIEPVDSVKENVKGAKDSQSPNANRIRPISRDEFQSISGGVAEDLFLKAQAQAFNASKEQQDSGGGPFIQKYRPDLYKRFQDAEKIGNDSMDDDAQDKSRAEKAKVQAEIDDIFDAVEKGNPYIRAKHDEKRDIVNNGPTIDGKDVIDNTYTGSGSFLPIFRGDESMAGYFAANSIQPVVNASGEKEYKVTLGGQAEGKREDGKPARFKATTIQFNPSTGKGVTGQNDDKTEWPFSMSLQIDAAVELVVGLRIACDETFGPFMGAYTIKSINETLTENSLNSVLEVATQSYLDGYGRSMNASSVVTGDTETGGLNSTDGTRTGVAVDGNGNALDNTNSNAPATAAGLRIVASARQALRASWSAKKPGYCNAFTRAVTEHAYGVNSSVDSGGAFGILFGGSPVAAGQNARNAGIYESYNGQALRAGDILLIETGSRGYGHIGINGGDGYVYENSWRHGENAPDGRYQTPAGEFLRERPTGIIRAEKFDEWAKKHGGK